MCCMGAAGPWTASEAARSTDACGAGRCIDRRNRIRKTLLRSTGGAGFRVATSDSGHCQMTLSQHRFAHRLGLVVVLPFGIGHTHSLQAQAGSPPIRGMASDRHRSHRHESPFVAQVSFARRQGGQKGRGPSICLRAEGAGPPSTALLEVQLQRFFSEGPTQSPLNTQGVTCDTGLPCSPADAPSLSLAKVGGNASGVGAAQLKHTARCRRTPFAERRIVLTPPTLLNDP